MLGMEALLGLNFEIARKVHYFIIFIIIIFSHSFVAEIMEC